MPLHRPRLCVYIGGEAGFVAWACGSPSGVVVSLSTTMRDQAIHVAIGTGSTGALQMAMLRARISLSGRDVAPRGAAGPLVEWTLLR